MEIGIEHQVLPPFRQDLQLFQGPDEQDGSPSFKVFDPVKAQYYKISWGESLIIKFHRPGMTVEKLCHEINTRSTLKVSPTEIYGYFQDASRHNLLAFPRTSEKLNLEYEHRKPNPFMWILLHYLYIRVPLWDPDSFLKRTLPYARLFASPFAFMIYSILTIIGLAISVTHLDEFLYTFPYFFSIQGIVFYALALTMVKIVHEFGHAYTAAHYGVRVPSVGIAFLVLWPVLFTDVTDAWKLLHSRHRLMISLAGIIVETVIAGLCTFGWAISPPGMLKNLFFVIASVSWFSTIILNANPCMRFDGYYILSDLWGVDNLQPRAFAVTRWKLREWLLGISTPSPESNLSPKRMRGMIIYSLVTWVYRLVLYTGIAIFVYLSFTKALGIFLFLLEIGIFLAWPIVSEIVFLFKARKDVKYKGRAALTSALLLGLFLWLATPLPRHERYTAITAPGNGQTLYVPYDSEIIKIFVKRGQTVRAGDLIIKLESIELEAELKKLKYDEELEAKTIKGLSYQDKDRAFISEQMKELQAIQAKHQGLRARKGELMIKAERDGILYDWDEHLKAGQSVTKDQVIGKIADTAKPEIVAFIPEDQLSYVHAGKKVKFKLDGNFKKYPAEVERINPVRASKLLYPSLASIYHGNLAISKDHDGNMQLLDSYFPVLIKLEENGDLIRYGQAGTVYLEGPKRSLLVSGFHKFVRLFWKESGGF